MRIIRQNAKFLEQDKGLEGMFKHIELAGRVCYNSEDKMTESSYNKFIDNLIYSGHTSVLEHGTIYLIIPVNEWQDRYEFEDSIYLNDPHTKVNVVDEDLYNMEGTAYITTNYRVIVEHKLYKDLEYLSEPTIHHYLRYTIKCTTDIGVSREFNRHRKLSVSERSTRYCDFSRDRFNNEISFILPKWINEKYLSEYDNPNVGELIIDDLNYQCDDSIQLWIDSLVAVEKSYLSLINEYGWLAQQARQLLPLNTATIVVYTGFEEDWKHFFDLRLKGVTGAPHPNMRELATFILDEFKNNNINFYNM